MLGVSVYPTFKKPPDSAKVAVINPVLFLQYSNMPAIYGIIFPT